MRTVLVIVATIMTVPLSVGAQDAPEVYTSASASETVAADLATLTVEFSVTRSTPGEAGRANAERANLIRAALTAIGIPNDSIVTRGYRAQLQVERNQIDTTFVATNTMVLRIRDLSLIGQAIDTSLGEGATRVMGPTFSATDVGPARTRVLAAATAAVRARAELMVSAIGQSLGALVEITTEAPISYGPGLGLNDIVVTGASAGSRTAIQVPAIQVSVVVYGRWKVRTP